MTKNGNMKVRGSANITWDAENRPISITTANGTTTFVYDGDGNRVKQIVSGQATLYVNKYYEKNLSTNVTTSYYYFGGKLVAMKQGSANVTFVHQDSLGGTSVVSDSNGALVSGISYSAFGERLQSQGQMPTDRLFTGQRLDGTGLYYYGARYYDPAIGRFISPDTIVQNPGNPQGLNRYSYVVNNPLRYTDPTGHWIFGLDDVMATEEQGMPVAQDVWDMALAFERFRKVEPDIARIIEDSEIFFNIQWGNGEGSVAETSSDLANGIVNIVLDKGKIQPDKNGDDATVWVLSHEIVHGVGRTVGLAPPTFWEEAAAMQFQHRVGGKIGFDPLAWPGPLSFFNTPIQSANSIVHRAMKVELSVDVTAEQTTQLRKTFFGTTYWDTYVTPDGRRLAYPAPDYRRQLLDIFR
ncbi:MAG: RHS repeat-associated core domain-containing protein [Chloroflexi bacterium]|nr:RHS repeat-associated core domain-containing protein [Chloroflexota bacterium]